MAKEQQAIRHLLAEHKDHSLSAKIATHQGTSASRRHRQAVDQKKELIAGFKARNPYAKARKICELMDQRINKEAPVLQPILAPLERWGKQVPGKRSWLDFYDHPKTHSLVRSYVNKVPPLKTASKSSK
jgi:hypothetical protein